MIEPHRSESSGSVRIGAASLVLREPEEEYRPRPKPRLLGQVREAIRTRHYSYRTEEAYVGWIRRFILFHNKRHPAEMGKGEVSAFLSSLATKAHVSASTQNQALNALVFLYRQVLGQQLGWLDEIVRAKRPRRLPVVLTRDEVKAILAGLRGREWLMVVLLYGAGVRLVECLSLRVKDIDFGRSEILVREGKCQKDRRTVLPGAAQEPLRRHLERLRSEYTERVRRGVAAVHLPDALGRKYPNAATERGWQWVFPASDLCTHPRTGERARFHLHESVLQRAVKAAARQVGLHKPVGCHTFRHSFRHASARRQLRHPDRPRVTGTRRCANDDDLHACPQSWRPGRAQPCRSPVRVAFKTVAPDA